MSLRSSRRSFLQQSALAAGTVLPYWYSGTRTMADDTKSANERPRAGC
ncbi:MAG: twin-arginine translocation signal domain-containing protein, partial [Planctomycetaceae bacterium]|nr:twin-arginine translocation signal domain-containing protein [Planctomycetaceae bacterium]